MKVFVGEIQNRRTIENDKTLKKAYAKRGNIGWYRVELFRVGDHYKLVGFNLLEQALNFFKSLCRNGKHRHFETLTKSKWKSHKVSWVQDLSPQQKKIEDAAQKQLQKDETPSVSPSPASSNLPKSLTEKGKADTLLREQKYVRSTFSDEVLQLGAKELADKDVGAVQAGCEIAASKLIKVKNGGDYCKCDLPGALLLVRTTFSCRAGEYIDYTGKLLLCRESVFWKNTAEYLKKAEKICSEKNLHTLYVPKIRIKMRMEKLGYLDYPFSIVWQETPTDPFNEAEQTKTWGLVQEKRKAAIVEHLKILFKELGLKFDKETVDAQSFAIDGTTGKLVLYGLRPEKWWRRIEEGAKGFDADDLEYLERPMDKLPPSAIKWDNLPHE